jgi:hypothetical protein
MAGWYVLFDDFIIGEAEDDEFEFHSHRMAYNIKFDSFKEAKKSLVNYHEDALLEAKDNLKRARRITKDD